MKLLFATTKAPMDSLQAQNFSSSFKKELIERGFILNSGITWADGPRCANLAFDISHPEGDLVIEDFAKGLSMGLMPCKWTTTGDPISLKDTFSLTR